MMRNFDFFYKTDEKKERRNKTEMEIKDAEPKKTYILG
jgi:hypothetical protein